MSPLSRIVVNNKIYTRKNKIAKSQYCYDGYSGKNNKAVIGRKIKISVYLVKINVCVDNLGVGHYRNKGPDRSDPHQFYYAHHEHCKNDNDQFAAFAFAEKG
jgi:hypothetical protein